MRCGARALPVGAARRDARRPLPPQDSDDAPEEEGELAGETQIPEVDVDADELSAPDSADGSSDTATSSD